MKKLKYSAANAKTTHLASVPSLARFLSNRRKVYSLDLLSGWSCPFAKECLSKVHIVDGKRSLRDGPDTKFRCFSASQEATYTNTYKARKYNFDLVRSLKSTGAMASLIADSMPKNLGICRIHVAGDFFNPQYFNAWAEVAGNYPDRLFYAYTKSLDYWVNSDVPDNFVLTASYGGKLDHLISSLNLRNARVVFSEQEAADLGLEIDHDDSHAADPSKESFALLIHGIQPKGSKASKAVRELKGKGSYRRKK